MIRLEINKQRQKIVEYNIVSAILIVLFWFILYYIFENHLWSCSSKEECLLIHKNIDWEWLNMTAFCIIYFIIELLNTLFTDQSFVEYAFIQAVLGFVIFCGCLAFMEMTSWYVPITGVNGFDAEKTKFKALIHFPYKYIYAMVFSNIFMAIMNCICKFLKSRKA